MVRTLCVLWKLSCCVYCQFIIQGGTALRKQRRSKSVYRPIILALIGVFCVIFSSYFYVENRIRDTIHSMIFENQFHHAYQLNSDPSLDEQLFQHLSRYNYDIKWHKGTETSGYRFYMISEPKIRHWFWGCECSWIYTYYSYEIGPDEQISTRYAGISIPVTVRMKMVDAHWEMISYFEPL